MDCTHAVFIVALTEGEGQTDPCVWRGDGQRDKADYRVCSPTVCSSTGAFQAPQPEKMRFGGQLRFSAAKISSAFGENVRVSVGVWMWAAETTPCVHVRVCKWGGGISSHGGAERKCVIINGPMTVVVLQESPVRLRFCFFLVCFILNAANNVGCNKVSQWHLSIYALFKYRLIYTSKKSWKWIYYYTCLLFLWAGCRGWLSSDIFRLEQ